MYVDVETVTFALKYWIKAKIQQQWSYGEISLQLTNKLCIEISSCEDHFMYI
jgi:hypothetical protein